MHLKSPEKIWISFAALDPTSPSNFKKGNSAKKKFVDFE